MKKRIVKTVVSMVISETCPTDGEDSSDMAATGKSKNSSQTQREITITTTYQTITTMAAAVNDAGTTASPSNNNRVVLDVKNIQAKPELPTGKEITAATMVLNYYGFNVTKMQMLEYLPTAKAPDKNGVWISPREAFVGDPKLDTGLGCYNLVIKKAIKNYWRANKITGYEVKDPAVINFTDLFNEIDKGNPVIIWASIDMKDIKYAEKGWKTDQGYFHWPTNEHCLVLIGYDKDKGTAIFSDPLVPIDVVEYPSEIVENVFKQMLKQALVIRKH